MAGNSEFYEDLGRHSPRPGQMKTISRVRCYACPAERIAEPHLSFVDYGWRHLRLPREEENCPSVVEAWVCPDHVEAIKQAIKPENGHP